MDENIKDLEFSKNFNNFNLFNENKKSNYIDIKSYDIKILDKIFLFKICRTNENRNLQIVFICKEKEKEKNINNIKEKIININYIENDEKENEKNNNNNEIYYEGKYTLEQLIINNKFFNVFDSVDEVINEIINLFDDNLEENINIYFENNNFYKLLLKLKFPILIKNNKVIILELFCKGINDKNINSFFYKEILLLQKSDNLLCKEIEELKKQNEIINNRLFKLENLIQKENLINNNNNKIENFFNNIDKEIINKNNINSFLLYKKEDIDFLNNRLLQDKDIPIGKNVKYKLLYRCSKDGQNSKDFHKLCDNYPQTLTVIKTVKGKIFGGYTEQTWKDENNNKEKSGTLKKDNKAFLFSLNKKKIYNIYYDQNAIWCNESNGPCFYGKGNFTIYTMDKLINGIMTTNKAKECTFSGMEKDYELTDGEEIINALEIEVFQILFV